MSGCTRMCAAMSLYDQSLLSVMPGTSLRAAQRRRGCRSGALRAGGCDQAIHQPVPGATPLPTGGERLSDACDAKPA
ncbi:hypothetical protein GCM10010275_23680 [Streptomyces litmocidini]|nr:hypothetical protein GCM10010275_23680 [Streptomyces litmocidini]